MAFGVLWFFVAKQQSLACEIDESGLACVREWLTATGGWVATVFAACTIYYLYQQVSEQKSQVAEQKKQTQFQLGDADPTLDVIVHQEDDRQLVVRIVNWNRRALIVNKLILTGGEGWAFAWDIFVNSRPNDAYGQSLDFMPPLVLDGWEDRQARPTYARIKIGAFVDEGMKQIMPYWPSTKVEADARLLGDVHRKIELQGINFIPEQVAGFDGGNHEASIVSAFSMRMMMSLAVG